MPLRRMWRLPVRAASRRVKTPHVRIRAVIPALYKDGSVVIRGRVDGMRVCEGSMPKLLSGINVVCAQECIVNPIIRRHEHAVSADCNLLKSSGALSCPAQMKTRVAQHARQVTGMCRPVAK